MRVVVALWLLAACSRIAGIGDEFHVGDGSIGGIADTPGGDARLLQQHAYIKASNPGAGDLFGFTVAISRDGSTLAVGAVFEDSDARTINGTQANELREDSGAVYVFARSGGTWTQQAYIKASNAEADDRLGYALAISDDGNTLAVGCPFENGGGIGPGAADDNGADNAGAAYVFTRSGTTWSEDVYLKASNTQVSDQFGYSVAVSGDGLTVAVGAHLEDSGATVIDGNQGDNGADAAGAVYVFSKPAGSWMQQAYVKASNTTASASFGRHLALSADGNTLAVGAQAERSAATGINMTSATIAAGSGAAYIFVRAGTSWSQQAYIKPTNTDAQDNFGASLDLSASGDVLVVGALGEDSNAIGIGGSEGNDAGSLNSGAAYVFLRSATVWSQHAYVKASNTGAGDLFGSHVAVASDGASFTLGAVSEDSAATGVDGAQQDETSIDSGAAYAFARTGATWTQTHYLKASNTEAGDSFGYLGARGLAAVGAPREDSAAPDIDGAQDNNSATDSGAVYVFE